MLRATPNTGCHCKGPKPRTAGDSPVPRARVRQNTPHNTKPQGPENGSCGLFIHSQHNSRAASHGQRSGASPATGFARPRLAYGLAVTRDLIGSVPLRRQNRDALAAPSASAVRLTRWGEVISLLARSSILPFSS